MSGSRDPLVVAVIPARGGSKRIPRKNLALLAGRPLVEHTIEAARAATLVESTWVSTDDAAIARVAAAAGAGVVLRPAELAGDATPSEDVLLHALSRVETRRGREVDVLVMLQCTSPLRTAATIDEAVRKLLVTGCDSVLSVTEDPGFFWFGRVLGDRFQPAYDPRRRPRTQEIAPGYRENGGVYVMRRDLLIRHHVRIGGHLRMVVQTPIESVDIDRPEDLRLCEAVLAASNAPGAATAA